MAKGRQYAKPTTHALAKMRACKDFIQNLTRQITAYLSDDWSVVDCYLAIRIHVSGNMIKKDHL